MLVSFLIVFLLYATYQPLRFSIEDKDRQARYASVFAVVAGAFVPLNFAAVRMAENLVHPRTLGTTTGGMPGSMMLTFLVGLAGMTLLFVTLWKYEMASKHTTFQLRALKRKLAGEDEFVPVGRSAAPTL
jgi:heme exporter protein C